MKINHSDGQLWVEDIAKGVFNIGITQEYLNGAGVIWVLIPHVEQGPVQLGEILAHYESSKGLGSFRVPITGTILKWNQSFLTTPDKIDPNQWLLLLKV